MELNYWQNIIHFDTKCSSDFPLIVFNPLQWEKQEKIWFKICLYWRLSFLKIYLPSFGWKNEFCQDYHKKCKWKNWHNLYISTKKSVVFTWISEITPKFCLINWGSWIFKEIYNIKADHILEIPGLRPFWDYCFVKDKGKN